VAFELPTISEAVRAGCDDCSPLAGLFLVVFILCRSTFLLNGGSVVLLCWV